MTNLIAVESVGISAILTGLMAILLLALACYVSYLRITLKIGISDGGNKVMRRGIRAHGNTVEHAVVFLPLVFLFDLLGAPDAAVWGLGGLFVASRYIYGFAMAKGMMPVRQITTAVVYVIELVMAVWLIVLAI